MKYIIMCSGNGTRWNNYTGVPKHLVKIGDETLLGRTTRLLKERNIEYLITSEDERYKEYGDTISQTYHDCEVDRFEEFDENVCYLYGDVYYTENAIDTIIGSGCNDVLFFGSEMEIFAVKVKDRELFYKHKNRVKDLYLKGKIDRCIGWEVYRSINHIPLEEYAITDRYVMILDDTDDIDYPEEYEQFVEKRCNNEDSSR